MNAIVKSIRPEWVCKILNGIMTVLISKTTPKCVFPIDVYLYCTFPKKHNELLSKDLVSGEWKLWYGTYTPKNGKVVAKFTLKKVKYYDKHWYCLEKDFDYVKELKSYDDIKPDDFLTQEDIDSDIADLKLFPKLLKESCLTQEELYKYRSNKSFYAWYIDDLVIFDEPKELSEFSHYKRFDCYDADLDFATIEYRNIRLTKAPASWCYVKN